MKQIQCGACPRGCALTIDEKTYEVSGNNCLRGPVYAKAQLEGEEIPGKIIVSSILCADGSRCSVMSDRKVPQWKLFDVMRTIKHLRLDSLPASNAVLIEDVCGTGANIIAYNN